MAKIGFNKKLYLQLTGSNYTMLKGETSSSFNLSADMIEVSDKEASWKKYVAGYKGGTVDATIYADTEDSAQKAVLAAIFEGSEVKCFIGEVGSSNTPTDGSSNTPTDGSSNTPTDGSSNTPTDGYAFAALVSSIGETYDTGSAIARSISLQITGEVTPYPSI